MAKRQVFYSFHYKNDVRRVAQIRNIGEIEENKPVSPNDWEEIRRKGDVAIEKWIDKNMENRTCLIVLIGSETANRPWVDYEIKHAWERKMGIFGIYIHNIKDPLLCKEGESGTCIQGKNPFDNYTVGEEKKVLSSILKCYNPNTADAYNDIQENLSKWVESAIKQAETLHN